jgi:hypothetical protein
MPTKKKTEVLAGPLSDLPPSGQTPEGTVYDATATDGTVYRFAIEDGRWLRLKKQEVQAPAVEVV